MPPSPERFAGSVVLTGPTASGKSALALDLAERIGGEILALDSMTLYRGMDIGTAKPGPVDRARVPHHLLDLLDPSESANVAWWLDRAADAVQDVRSRGRVPIFVGGTPFYLKTLLHGLFESPPVPAEVRAKWEAEADRLGPAALHAKLAEVDPPTAARLHPNDVRRVVRALEVHEATGHPISALQQSWSGAASAIPVAVLDVPRDELNARIDRRVETMIAAGWIDEVRELSRKPLGKEASQALGYAPIAEHLRGLRTFEETIAEIRLRTRQFAKRQRTWFRSLRSAATVSTPAEALATWGL